MIWLLPNSIAYLLTHPFMTTSRFSSPYPFQSLLCCKPSLNHWNWKRKGSIKWGETITCIPWVPRHEELLTQNGGGVRLRYPVQLSWVQFLGRERMKVANSVGNDQNWRIGSERSLLLYTTSFPEISRALVLQVPKTLPPTANGNRWVQKR